MAAFSTNNNGHHVFHNFTTNIYIKNLVTDSDSLKTHYNNISFKTKKYTHDMQQAVLMFTAVQKCNS